MQKSITTNVEQLLRLLRHDCLVGEERSASLKLLIAEEDQLGRDLEGLELANDRAEIGRVRLRKN